MWSRYTVWNECKIVNVPTSYKLPGIWGGLNTNISNDCIWVVFKCFQTYLFIVLSNILRKLWQRVTKKMDFRVSCIQTNKMIIFLEFILIIPLYRFLGRSVQRGNLRVWIGWKLWELETLCLIGSVRPNSDGKVLRQTEG